MATYMLKRDIENEPIILMRLSGVQMERLDPEFECLPTTSNGRGSAGRRTGMLSALKKPLKLLSASEEHARMFSGKPPKAAISNHDLMTSTTRPPTGIQTSP